MTFVQNKKKEKPTHLTTKWSVGEYNRLSKEDGDKPESDSIQNQHSINQKHLEYLREQGEQIESVTVYSDDGYAGGNFKRPRYQALIRDIESGKINCIIFKDNSRLGRNYPELGRLMEDYFPQKGVRVISVLNNLDSVKDPRGYCSAIVSFSNIVNDDYIRQLSIKIKCTLTMKRERGEFIGNYAPFGYQKDPADRHRLGILNLFKRFQQRSTGIILVCQKIAFDLHSGKSVRGVRMCRHGLHICFQTGDGIFRRFNLLREVTQKIVLQLILLTLMAGAHQPQAGNVHIQVHLFLDALVTGAERLDLCVGQRRFVNVLTGAYRRFGGHNLRDESLLIFNRLPEVGVERSLGHIAVNMHFLVAVALTDDAATALLQIARPPRTVEVMQRDEPVLDIHTRTHLKGAAHQDAHLPGAHLCKQLFFADFGV